MPAAVIASGTTTEQEVAAAPLAGARVLNLFAYSGMLGRAAEVAGGLGRPSGVLSRLLRRTHILIGMVGVALFATVAVVGWWA